MLLLPFQITCSELLLMKPHIGRTDLQSKNEKSRQRKKKKSRGLRGHGAARGHAQTGQEHHSASALTPKSQTCIHQIISSSFHISPCLSACNLASTRLITYIQRQRQRSLLHRAPLWTHHPFIPAFIPRRQGKEEQRQFLRSGSQEKTRINEDSQTHTRKNSSSSSSSSLHASYRVSQHVASKRAATTSRRPRRPAHPRS